MASSLGPAVAVAARASHSLLATVGSHAHRCSFRGLHQWQRPSQQLLIKRSLQPRRGFSAAAAGPGMDPAVEVTVEKIHSTTVRIVLYLGGGGSQVGACWRGRLAGGYPTAPPCRVPPFPPQGSQKKICSP